MAVTISRRSSYYPNFATAPRGRVLATAMDILTQTGKVPSERTVGQELGITRQQANRHLKALREAGLI